MTKASISKKGVTRDTYWRERIPEQERSGMSVQRFCEEQGLTEQSFYVWRKRLRKQQPIRFAVVETGAGRQPAANGRPGLEVVLTNGERLRIDAGVDPGVLRAMLEVLRG